MIDFNPWEWEGPKQVAEAFFARLIEEIGRRAPNGDEISARLSRYAAYFTLGASIAESAAAILPLFAPGVGPLATLLGKSLTQAGKQAKAASDARPKNEPLSELRENVSQSIKAMAKTIIVTIDDVDRLTTAETAILFQLLKSNADFPNIVYLILCDREVVARNLENVVSERGDKYLEKIVQLGLPLPKSYPEKLRAILLDGLIEIVRKNDAERLLDRDRLFNLYDHHASSYFRTMRDVKRFLATFATLVPALVHGRDADVDLVDFVGIEILRAFAPDFYESIYCSFIIGVEGLLSEGGEFLKKLAGKREPNDPAMGIFGELFPRFGPQKLLVADMPRVAHSRAFDRYFIFAIPPDQYSGAEENDVLARRTHPGFEKELETARSRGRLQYLLELLLGASPPSAIDGAVEYLAALGTFADTLRPDAGVDDRGSYRTQLYTATVKCLRALNNALWTDIVVTASRKSTGIWLPLSFISGIDAEHPAMINDAGISVLRELAAKRIASLQTLVKHPALREILLWWLENGDEAGARRMTETLIESENGLFDVLSAFSVANVFRDGNARRRRSGIHALAEDLDRLVPIRKIIDRLEDVDDDALTWEQRILAEAFRERARYMATQGTSAELQP